MLTKTLSAAGDKTEPLFVPPTHRYNCQLNDVSSSGASVNIEWLQVEAGKDQQPPSPADSRWSIIETYTAFPKSKTSDAGGAWFRAHLTAISSGSIQAIPNRSAA